ncbi:MAG: YbhB/YbcL family Raf kinase inhibitor-like protein [Oliverpabstia sp.]
MKELFIKSSQFKNNDWIPDCCSGYGNDESPELYIEDLPAETVTLAIVMDDLDHPIHPEFNHWVAWNLRGIN